MSYLFTCAVGTPTGGGRLPDCEQSPAQREKLARTGPQSSRLKHMRTINRKTTVRPRRPQTGCHSPIGIARYTYVPRERAVNSSLAEIQNPDPATEVGIALSKRAAGSVFDSGYIGSRIVWVPVKVRGWMCDMCVIGVYMPHRFRKRAPFQQDTLGQLRLFADVCRQACAG